ncbi:MAG: hypothetical protein P9L92_09335 [Candidatus Electryonea clarkiae]|nr:hypothetical protein [Candidatus Electryonea clarkiae]MDP8288139.1 hypothetical protein [Candidatus Electryonea clarkiae]
MLKHLFLLNLMIFFGFSIAAAQNMGSLQLEKEEPPFQKGTIDLGGSFSFESISGDAYEDIDGNGATRISFAPDVGYFVMDKMSVGGLLRFDSESIGDTSSQDLFIGPRVNYYLRNDNHFRHFYGQFSILYRAYSSDSVNDLSGNWFKIQFGPGIQSFWNKYVSWNALVYVSMDQFTPEDGDSLSGMEMGLRLGLSTYIF